jgi:uncharacterized SAM-binding protein YcdF (DUF218 family)/glycosyltransferase involved in cell wall biosynthesis
LPRIQQRIRNWLRGTKGFRQEQENLFVYSPLVLPFPYSRIATGINRFLLLRALQRWMRAMGFGRPIVWTFLPTPLTLEIIRELEPEVTVYYCIDDLASSSRSARRISRSERAIFREADLVFVTSEKLRARAARYASRVYLFPFGVDFAKFERIRDHTDAIPDELKLLSRPIIGYIGGIHQWVDQQLLAAVAGRMPEANFVLVGPRQTDVSELARCPNVHLFGARRHDEIPRYIKAFDVAVVPYRSSEYTAHVYPTKLNEYLAMGKPVVATDLPEIRRFNVEHGNVVSVGLDAAEFSEALRRASAPQSWDTMRRRIEVAKENSWARRIEQMAGLIERQLATRREAGVQWQDSLRRLYRKARHRVFGITIAVALGYALLFHSPFVWFLAGPLRMEAPVQAGDAIVVFAGGVGESGKAGGGYQERVKRAVELYQDGQAPQLIFSSGYTFVFPEAEMMKELALSQGLPATAIILEQQARNTHENVTRVQEILDRHGWTQIILVSSPFHMRRAVWTWRKAAPDVTVIPAPVQASQFYAHGGKGLSLEQIGGILHEYLGIVYYWLKGWI